MYAIEPDVLYSFVFLVAALCFVFPPKEVVSAGLTIQNIFSPFLGSEEVNFVAYHVKRTSTTVLAHSFIPLAYYAGLRVFATSSTWSHHPALILFCICVPVLGAWTYLRWKYNSYQGHPLVKLLAAHGTPWQSVAQQIDSEFRAFDKFSSVTGGTKLYVTTSWILKCTAYYVHVAQQTDSHLHVMKTEEHFFAHEQTGHQPAQYLHIRVSSVNPRVEAFDITLNSTDYNDMKDRLNAPIVAARNIVIHQSLSDRFLEAFREQVLINGRVSRSSVANNQELESCIGCMARTAEVKLVKRCGSTNEAECSRCYCRPMWCIECMGRWFASRQDQHAPETWMASLSPCPTCRAKFCMLDIQLVDG